MPWLLYMVAQIRLDIVSMKFESSLVLWGGACTMTLQS